MSSDDYTMISATVVHTSRAALKIRRDREDGELEAPEWVPRAHIKTGASLWMPGDADIFEVETWLATERGWPEAK